jgi:nitrate reductase gamma subunit
MHRRFNLLGELRFMAAEMVFLKGLWEWNRRLWYRSFPFHAGLYLLATAAFLLVVSAALTTVGQGPDGNGLAAGLRVLYRLAGGIGTVAAVAGAIALLHRRLTDRALRLYFVPADAANLAFFIVTIGLLAVGYLAAGSDFPGALEFTRALLRFDTTVTTPWLLGAGLLLASALVGYIPMTHMAHFIAKWFTYHAVRWDDRPLVRGDKLEHRIAACLAMRPTWAAPHIAADGTKTWARLATTNPVEGKKK